MFCYTHELKKEETSKNYLVDDGRQNNLPLFQGERPDYVLEESSICCLPRELASSVHPRELLSFDP